MSTLLLGEQLDITQVNSLKTQFLNRENQSVYKVDASKVNRVDAAGIQFLVSLIQSCRSQSIEVKFLSVSDSLRDAFCLLGVSEFLDLD